MYSRALTAACCPSLAVLVTCWRMMAARYTVLRRSLQASGWLQHWVLAPPITSHLFSSYIPQTSLPNLSHPATSSHATLVSSSLTHPVDTSLHVWAFCTSRAKSSTGTLVCPSPLPARHETHTSHTRPPWCFSSPPDY